MQTITYYAKPNARAGHGFVPIVESTMGDRLGSPYSAIGYDLDTARRVACSMAHDLFERLAGDYDVTIVEGT
jgi:hypothetical protein